MRKILTVPEEITDPGRSYLTGNEYVSLPVVNVDGSLDRLNVLSMRKTGLLEIIGQYDRPLMKPFVMVAEKDLMDTELQWQRRYSWLPEFVSKSVEGLTVRGTIFAPLGEKGFVYHLEVANEGEAREIEIGLRGSWGGLLQTVYTERYLPFTRTIEFNKWSEGLVFEALGSSALIGMAIGSSVPTETIWAGYPDKVILPPESLPRGIPFTTTHRARLGKGETKEVSFFVAVNREKDGARTTVVHLKRRGAKKMLEETQKWLAARYRKDESLALTEKLNLNLFFNYFYAQGLTIDTEELVLVTSRSPRYYVSAAFWARDALLWSLPGIILIDANQGRKVLETAYTTYGKNLGIHSLYIDGTVLYPGYEQDELVAYIVAVDTYLKETKDYSILNEEWFEKGIRDILTILAEKRDTDTGLYETFLCPSDDPATYPYLTYDNVLTWKALKVLSEIYRYTGSYKDAELKEEEARELKESILKYCVVDGPKGKMFAWSVDGKGNYELYDEPPGSLELLTYYGFLDSNEPLYINTMAWLYSEANPYYYEGRFSGLGCQHAEHPFVMNVFNRLLQGRDEATIELLESARWDNGLACESFSKDTGVVKTGAAFATCAGMLGYAMVYSRREKQ